MKPTPQYDRRFKWLRYSADQNATYGDRPPQWDTVGRLWGSLTELSAARQQVYGAEYGRVLAEVHLRQWPAVQERDRLQDIETSHVYELDGPPQKAILPGGPKELICTVHRGSDIQDGA